MKKMKRSMPYLFFISEKNQIMKRLSLVHGQVRSHMEFCTGSQSQNMEKGLHLNVCDGAMNSVTVCVETLDRKIRVCSVYLRRMDLPSAR